MTLTEALRDLIGRFEAGPRAEATLWPLPFAANIVTQAEERAGKPMGTLQVQHEENGMYMIRRGKRGRYLAVID